MLPFRFIFELFDIVFEFVLIFEFIFEFDIFEFDIVLTVAIGVAIGVGLDILVFIRLALLAVLLAPVSPHPAANAPIASTAVSAIFFMILCDLLSSSKLLICLTAVSAERCFAPSVLKLFGTNATISIRLRDRKSVV